MTVALLLFSCNHGKKQYTDAITCRDSIPGMTTYDIVSLVSDSGIVRYKIIAARWDIYDRLDPPKWAFEEGVYLEKFADSLTIDAIVKADTAYYFEKDELWELHGHVHIENLQDELFDTDLLFWNQKTERVWSEHFIRIVQKDRIITGFGFTSNQQFDRYTIRNTQGIFPIDDKTVNRNKDGEVIADSTIYGNEEDGDLFKEIDRRQATDTIHLNRQHTSETEQKGPYDIDGNERSITDTVTIRKRPEGKPPSKGQGVEASHTTRRTKAKTDQLKKKADKPVVQDQTPVLTTQSTFVP